MEIISSVWFIGKGNSEGNAYPLVGVGYAWVMASAVGDERRPDLHSCRSPRAWAVAGATPRHAPRQPPEPPRSFDEGAAAQLARLLSSRLSHHRSPARIARGRRSRCSPGSVARGRRGCCSSPHFRVGGTSRFAWWTHGGCSICLCRAGRERAGWLWFRG